MQKAAGHCLFLAIWTRPDIAYAVSTLCRFATCPDERHIRAMSRLIGYLKYTAELGITYSRNPTLADRNEIFMYSDASYARDPISLGVLDSTHPKQKSGKELWHLPSVQLQHTAYWSGAITSLQEVSSGHCCPNPPHPYGVSSLRARMGLLIDGLSRAPPL